MIKFQINFTSYLFKSMRVKKQYKEEINKNGRKRGTNGDNENNHEGLSGMKKNLSRIYMTRNRTRRRVRGWKFQCSKVKTAADCKGPIL